MNAYGEAHEHMHEGPFREQLEALRRAGATERICYLFENLAILIYECEDIDESFAMEHFKAELVDDLDDDNTRRRKVKRKGLLPALHRRQALSAA